MVCTNSLDGQVPFKPFFKQITDLHSAYCSWFLYYLTRLTTELPPGAHLYEFNEHTLHALSHSSSLCAEQLQELWCVPVQLREKCRLQGNSVAPPKLFIYLEGKIFIQKTYRRCINSTGPAQNSTESLSHIKCAEGQHRARKQLKYDFSVIKMLTGEDALESIWFIASYVLVLLNVEDILGENN